MDFGVIDPDHGFIHFPETWRYGRYQDCPSIVDYWEGAMRESACIHMMQHGYRIPGTWKQGLSLNPARAFSHLIYGNLSGIFKAASAAGVEWGNLETEACLIRETCRIAG